MKRPAPDDRQRVIDLTHAILRREGWRVHVNPLRIVRPCVWVEESIPAGLVAARAGMLSVSMYRRGGRSRFMLLPVRAPEDGTGRGWHRRAAERIAATVRGWR